MHEQLYADERADLRSIDISDKLKSNHIDQNDR